MRFKIEITLSLLGINRYSTMLDKAKLFAINAHGDQLYGDQPYSVHLERVVSLLSGHGEIAQIIGYLHDVVEDTEVSITDIKNEFGQYIADCVSILTDEYGQNRKERKAKAYAKMSKVSGELELALVVKAADRLANLQEGDLGNNTRLIKMYKKEHEEFKSNVQRDGLAVDIWQQIELLLADSVVMVKADFNASDSDELIKETFEHAPRVTNATQWIKLGR